MRIVVITAALAAGAVACGGGDSGPVVVTFDPPNARLCAGVAYPNPPTVHAMVRLSRDPGPVREVRVYVPAGLIDPGWVVVSAQGDNTYELWAPVVAGLAEGSYAGSLSFDLCQDPTCAGKVPVEGAALPFTLEVVPWPTLSVTVNGTPATGGGAFNNDFSVSTGDVVDITSSAPVVWGTGSQMGTPTVTTLGQTATTWRGSVSASSSEWVEIRGSSSCDAVTSAGIFLHGPAMPLSREAPAR